MYITFVMEQWICECNWCNWSCWTHPPRIACTAGFHRSVCLAVMLAGFLHHTGREVSLWCPSLHGLGGWDPDAIRDFGFMNLSICIFHVYIIHGFHCLVWSLWCCHVIQDFKIFQWVHLFWKMMNTLKKKYISINYIGYIIYIDIYRFIGFIYFLYFLLC